MDRHIHHIVERYIEHEIWMCFVLAKKIIVTILYTIMSEKSMNEVNGKLIREIQTRIEELQKYKTDNIDKFKDTELINRITNPHLKIQYGI